MSGKQLCKLLAVILVVYCFAHGLIYFGGENIIVAINMLLDSSPYVVAIVGAMTFGMFTYVDNTAKDLTDVRNDVDREMYGNVQVRFSDLKREILFNVALIVGFFLISYTAKAIMTSLTVAGVVANSWLVGTVGTSIRFSCFVIIVLATIVQFSGFVIVVEFRELIARNRK